jgi:predicted MFS family arabinose efflux permease
LAQPSALRVAVLGLAALAIAMGIGRFAFTPLLPMMRQDGLIDIAGGGVLAAVHFLGYWLGAVSAARLPLAPRAAFLMALAAIGFGTLGMGLTDSFAIWLVWRFAAGVCSAWVLVLVGTHAVKALAEAGGAPKQGWVFAGVGAGIAVTGLACLAFMASGVGSAVAWLIIGAVALAASAVVAAGMGGLFPASRPPARRHGSERAPLDWRVVIAYGVMGLGYIIPATYLPVMAKAAVADPLVFGWSWPVFGAAAFVSTIVGGRLHARYTNRQIWAAG